MTLTEAATLTLGADPELIIFEDGQMVRADECFIEDEEFGCDGNSSVAELRPKPALTPLGLIEYIGALLNWGHEKFPKLEFRAGAMVHDYPIGGHIHLGCAPTPARIANMNAVTQAFETLVYKTKDLEDRRNCDYGRIGDFRRTAWGIEYRTPASWLISPAIALAMISLIKIAIVNEDINLSSMYIIGQEKEFLLSLKSTLVIPEDCEEGVTSCLEEIFSTEYNVNILKNWLED